MKKKIVSALLCVAMAASLVVGCGSKSGSDSGSSKGGDKLVYWAMWSEDEPQAKVIKEAISKYEKDTGVKVDVQFKGRTGQREGLEPALSAKQQIDLFDEDVNRVNGSWGKYLLDLEDMAKDYESEHGNETLFKIARNAYGQTHDGDDTLHSIPYQPSIFGFFYNKTLFTKAGIESVPTTWEELDAACAKLKEAGITPITADDAYLTSFIGYHLARYIGQDGVKALVTGEDNIIGKKQFYFLTAAVDWPSLMTGLTKDTESSSSGDRSTLSMDWSSLCTISLPISLPGCSTEVILGENSRSRSSISKPMKEKSSG